jgi:hypothetical protein
MGQNLKANAMSNLFFLKANAMSNKWVGRLGVTTQTLKFIGLNGN